MKRIFKTVSGKKKSTFMIGGKHICPHDRKSVKMAIGKVAGSVLAGILAVTATPLMAEGLTASALSPAQSVVFAWTPANGQIRLNGGAEVYDVKTDGSSRYVELNDVKYYQDMREETSYWVREGFSIETDESGISGITAGEAANWNGVITSSGSTILPSDTYTVLNDQLQTVNLDNYVSSSNSSTTRLNDRDTLLDQSGERLSTMEVHYQNGQYYVGDGDNRKEVPVGALYSKTTIGQGGQSKLVAVVTQDGKIYTGDVVGENGEILKSGIENSELYSYWANQTADPLKGATVGQVQAVIDTMKENGKNLANADIQGITVNDGIATITRKNGDSAGKFEAGNNVTITSGENGGAIIAATDTITTVSKGSDYVTVTKTPDASGADKADYAVDLSDTTKQTLAQVKEGMNYSADSGSVVNRQLGQTVAIKGDSGNISTETTSGGIKIKLADDVRVNSVEAKTEVKVGNTSVRSDGVTINRDNGQSMVFTRQRVDMGGQQVHGVAAGTADTDAVNFAQLKATEAQFNQRLGDMDNHINRVEDNAYAGVAMALATAGLPQAWQPGKSMIAAAAGTYMGEQGYAFGLSYNTEDGRYTFKATASGNSQGHFGGSVGAGYMW
ncbi:YadA-like family protein [Oxalobacter aliiformigenes]|uniref:YadA family autotransporter adhesin n=1 Tax=Oxalobacter aliiformigenes TaxID=2946593 RepID=UPI0022AEC921|nr:YadA family autotransporter adhesin [Oxalobacter aliiformigenes]MCZ4065823.1 YadA-like family protein [Oxalobacter aliiformigenes]WAW00316.1 YadA-like family protein [Oxalobacter aliiformigenes]